MPVPSIDLSWLGGGVGGLLRGDRGGYVGGGKANAFRNFTEGAAKATDEQFASDSKKARSLRQYLAEVDPTLKDQVQAMGLGDLEGKALTLARKRMDAEQNQKSQAEYLRMLATADEINARRRAEAGQAAGESALGRYMQALGQPVPPESIQAPGFTPQGAALQAAGPDLAKAPAASLRAFADFMPEAVGSNPVEFQEDPATGYRFARLGNVLSPSGINPEKISSVQTQTVMDANGLPITVIGNNRGSWNPVENRTGTLTAAQVEENLRLVQRDADDTSKLINLVKANPELAKQFSLPDLEAKLKRSQAEVQRFDAMRKGSGAAAAAPASGGVTIKSIKQIR